jgi:hypothetical protein
VRKWRRETVKRLLCCGFRRARKAMGQVYQSRWRICREINVFKVSNITCFRFHFHFWHIYWLFLVESGKIEHSELDACTPVKLKLCMCPTTMPSRCAQDGGYSLLQYGLWN